MFFTKIKISGQLDYVIKDTIVFTFLNINLSTIIKKNKLMSISRTKIIVKTP